MSAGQHLVGSRAQAELDYEPHLNLEDTVVAALRFFREQGMLPAVTLPAQEAR